MRGYNSNALVNVDKWISFFNSIEISFCRLREGYGMEGCEI